MFRVKKGIAILALSLAAVSLLSGCKKDEGESESGESQVTEAATGTGTEGPLEKTGKETLSAEYISKDKSMSIRLPDATWENTTDDEGKMIFESKGKGVISVVYITNVDIATMKLPASKEEVLNNLKDTGKNISKYEAVEFEQQKVGTNNEYHTTVKCTDMTERYSYTIGYDIVGTDHIYSVTGLVEQEDEALMARVRDAVESFKVLKKLSATAKTDANTRESEAAAGTADSSGASNMVVYDSNGNPIYLTKDASGIWKDSSGKTYDVQQYGVMGSDGYWYTFEGPAGTTTEQTTGQTSATEATEATEATGNTTTTESSSNNDTVEKKGFYDNNGNYVETTKNANGDWVDAYGTIYYYNEDGIKDNSGNDYDYKGAGDTNGFMDSSGNYVTVTKDQSGNWVDSSGMSYTFGDEGVTDANGNFYPY